MSGINAIAAHAAGAAGYDQSAEQYGWRGHEILFGMCHTIIEPGMDMLDLGTGSGLAAWPFIRHGLQAFGLDGSRPMLEQAAAKKTMRGLVRHDIGSALPFAGEAFDMVLACGLLHFFSELGPIFSEASRVLRPGGTLALTARTPDRRRSGTTATAAAPPIAGTVSEGVQVYIHSTEYIDKALLAQGLATLKTVDFLCAGDYRSDLPGLHHARIAVKPRQ